MTIKLNKVIIDINDYKYDGKLKFKHNGDKLTSKGVVDLNCLSRNLKSRIEHTLRDIELELNGTDTSYQKVAISNYDVSFNKNLGKELFTHNITIKGHSNETSVNLKQAQLEYLYTELSKALNK